MMKKYLKVFGLGLLAGCAIGLGCILYSLAFLIPTATSVQRLIGSLFFSIGLILVCLFKLNLFTGKVGVVFKEENPSDIKQNFINLGLMLLANIISISIIGVCIYYIANSTEAFIPWKEALDTIASSKYVIQPSVAHKLHEETIKYLIESIMCGILVYLAVYSYNNLINKFSKIMGIIVFISMFVYLGFQHSIANCFYYAYTVLGNPSAFTNVLLSLIYAVLGNSLGALLINELIVEKTYNK